MFTKSTTSNINANLSIHKTARIFYYVAYMKNNLKSNIACKRAIKAVKPLKVTHKR